VGRSLCAPPGPPPLTPYQLRAAVEDALDIEPENTRPRRYLMDDACGLALGSYLSQWCGTFYLDGLDHFVKRELKIRGYLRYMDDFVLFSDDRSQLVNAHAVIAAWLAEERQLRLHPKRWNVLSSTHPSIFLGYRISRAGVTPSRKLRRAMPRRLRTAASKGYEALVRSIQSYRGLLLF
jgi:reverse transcriptase-like protein